MTTKLRVPDGWVPYAKAHGQNHTVTGHVLVWPKLESPAGLGAREIVAYLPPSYSEVTRSKDRRYPVLYFHDGQNVFDEKTSYSGKWGADEALEALAAEGLEAIAVAVPNRGAARMDEYNPWREKRRWHGKLVGGKGDAYVSWLAGPVKSLIDRSFPTDPSREATGVAGSSMGGLISLYAPVAAPETFGMVVAMSPSITWHDYHIVRLIEEGKLPQSRIYIDMGGREWRGGLDDARRLRDALLERGWESGRDLEYVEDRYAAHNESAWARRLPDALRFLLSPFRR